jgi:arabinan endo-1,5-alpha-L-arabinosidase
MEQNMDKRIIGRFSRGAAMAAVLSTAGCKSQSLRYTNPVWDANLADPAVLGWNGEWYAYGTGSEEGTNRQFPMLHSTDFVHWEPVGYAMEALEKPQFKEYWAPEVVERDGVFYLFYAGNRRMRVAQAESPLGPFTDCGVYLFPEWEFSIDGHPFCDPDTGEWYLFFARDFLDVERVGTGLSVVRLGDDMISVQGPVQTVLTAFADWQIYKRNRRMYDGVYDWHTVEGPWVVKRNGLYYCFYSASNWQTPHYGVGFAVAEHPMGPWMDGGNTEYATVLNGMDNGLIGPGHNSVAIGLDGETHFMVYHSWNPERTARVMCIDPIEWTSDGPRVVNPAFGNKVFAR